MTREQLEAMVRPHMACCIRDFGYGGRVHRCWTLLLTGTDEALLSYGGWSPVDWLDRKRQTARARLWVGEEDPIDVLLKAVAAADHAGVTLQLLCTHGADESTRTTHSLGRRGRAGVAAMRETYPVVHLAKHGLKWGKDDDDGD